MAKNTVSTLLFPSHACHRFCKLSRRNNSTLTQLKPCSSVAFSITLVLRLSNVKQCVQFFNDKSATESRTGSPNYFPTNIIHDCKTYSDLLVKSKLPLSFLGRPLSKASAVPDMIDGSFSRNHSCIFVYPEKYTSIATVIGNIKQLYCHSRRILTCPNVFDTRKNRPFSAPCTQIDEIHVLISGIVL